MKGVAWITGAGKGIGHHTALELASRGWTIAATARTTSDLDDLVAMIKSNGYKAKSYPSDVTNPDQIVDTIDRIESELGPITLAILNAGTYVRFGIDDFTISAFRAQLEVNVMGTINCLSPIIKLMLSRHSGKIAVISSLTSYRGLPFASAYGSSKAALTNMCEALKPELELEGVDICVVHPGFVRTPLTNKNKFYMPFIVEPDLAAKKIVNGIFSNKFEIYFPFRLALLLKIGRLLPYKLYFSLTRRLTKKV